VEEERWLMRAIRGLGWRHSLGSFVSILVVGLSPAARPYLVVLREKLGKVYAYSWFWRRVSQ
jgi:hypothetical protein